MVHGGAETTVDERGYRRVPKRELVGTTQVVLQQGRLKFAAGLPLVPTLKEELTNFRLKVTDAGHDTYEAWREGQHDDLVFATCLATWYAEGDAAAADWLARHPTGEIKRPPAHDRHRAERTARGFFGRGVDPRSGPRIGRNGPTCSGIGPQHIRKMETVANYAFPAGHPYRPGKHRPCIAKRVKFAALAARIDRLR